MRKYFFVAAILILTVNFVSAQSQSQKTRWGFYAGPVAATMVKYKVTPQSGFFQRDLAFGPSEKYAMGATIGILLDVPMQKHGSFQTGLNYIGKNSKDNYIDNTGQTVKTKTTLSYLEVPINVLFRIPAGGGKVTWGGGVSAGMALDGQISTTAGSVIKDDKKLGFGDLTTDDFGKYDFGVNVLAGYEFTDGFFVTLNYNHGINRLIVGGDPRDKLYNRYIALRAGFLLGGGKK
jgi:hypothetical protein